MRVVFGLLLAACLGFTATAVQAGGRAALVLSAQKYQLLRPLANPDHDARAVADVLERLGFDVTVEPDRSLKRMRRALDDFREDASGSDVALVFFAGHGVEIGGENRLLPVDADASSLNALKQTSLPLEEVRATAAAVAPAVIILLDACRDDPFGEGGSGEGRSARPLAGEVEAAARPGLGRIGEAANTLFMFSAAPGRTASDGAGDNSPFSAALARYLPADGLEIRSALSLVQQEVYDASAGRQSPWIESAPFPRLFFAGETGVVPERERLLLAMADVTPDLRDEVEKVAAANNVPLAPLYGALIAADLKTLGAEDRSRKLAESASAYADTQDTLKALSSNDPSVARLRDEAERTLAIGAFSEARKTLAEAAAIDARSADQLAGNLVERRLSEAATHVADSGIARTELDYAAAIAALEQAAALHRKIEHEDVPDKARRERDWLLASLGDLNLLVGDTGKALDAYQRMRAAAAIRMESSPGMQDAEHDLAASLNNIGDVQMAQGDLGAALDNYLASRAIFEKEVVLKPEIPSLRNDLAVSWDRIGDVKAAQGNLTSALEAFGASLALRRALVEADPDNETILHDMAASIQNIGNLKLDVGDFDGALAAHAEDLAISQRLADRDPANLPWQRDLSVAWLHVGNVKMVQDDVAGALDAYLHCLAISQMLTARDPTNAEWQRDLAVGWTKIGGVRHKMGDLAAAEEAYSRDLQISKALVARDAGNIAWLRDLSVTWTVLGDTRFDAGNGAAAVEAYGEALAIARKLVETDATNTDWQRDLAVAFERVGDARKAAGDSIGAREAYRTSMSVTEMLSGRDPANADWQRDVVVSHYKLAEVGIEPRLHYTRALELAEAMRKKGMLAPADAFIPDMLRRKLAQLK